VPFQLQKSKPFAGLGLVCDEASTGEDSLKQFHALKDGGPAGAGVWDLVLMDEHLSPDPCQLRGTQVIQLMRAAGYVGAVVSCSGNCTEADKDSYKEAGANAVWPKPFPTPEDMMQDLCEWVHAGALAKGAAAAAAPAALVAPAVQATPASVAAVAVVAAEPAPAAPPAPVAAASVEAALVASEVEVRGAVPAPPQ
jgi:CheY-like chemotaxis protein